MNIMEFVWISLIIGSIFLIVRERTKRYEEIKQHITILQIMIEALSMKVDEIKDSKDSTLKKENNE